VEWRCPVCDSGTRRVFLIADTFPIRECGACRHRFTEWQPSADHVSTVYADSYFFGGGAGYPDYLSESALLRERGRRYASLISPHTGPGRLLDIGAASGFLCDGFRSEGWRPEGLEPNETMVRYGRETLNIPLHTGALEHFNSPDQYDLISMIQVLGHFISPRRALEKAASLTRDGGFWLIETWDNQSLTARAFGQRWHEYSPPSVLNYFSRRSLEQLAGQFGFRRIAGGHPRKQIMWGHARSLIGRQIASAWFDRLTGLIPDRTVLPYPSEDLIWILFQKSSEAA
jgi:hypothetical protein